MKSQAMVSMSNAMSRVGMCGILAITMGCGAIASQAAVCPEHAGAAVVVNDSYVKVKAPKSWKKQLKVSSYGNKSGAFHIDFVTKGSASLMPLRIDGTHSGSAASGKTGFSYKGKSGDTINWKVARGKEKANVSALNAPLAVWKSAHGKGGYSLTKSQSKKLLKLFTGDKAKYSKVVKWSQSTAKKKGAKIERKWLESKVISKVQPL